MSERNKNNRIIFLTTLSVYLGLVLVGGVPPVLAQDGVLKISQIKRDKKFVCPNYGLVGDEKGKEINPFDYDLAKRLIELVQTTDVRLEIVKKLEPESLTTPFYYKSVEFAPYLYEKAASDEFDEEDESCEWASAAHAGQISELHSLFLNPLCDCGKPSSQKFALNSSDVRIDDEQISFEFSVRKALEKRASQLVENLEKFFNSQTSLTVNPAVKQIYKHTQVWSENDQVFIVTRLPRGSLDELLKQNAKAENK